MFRLRELEKKDLVTINQWRNDSELINCLGSPFRYIAEEVDEMWYNNYLNNRDKTIRCAIIGDEFNDCILGLVSLTNINSINRNAELHIMIGSKKHRGIGLGTFAVKTMIEHAFKNLNLHRIELEVLDDNVVAKKLYTKIGFVEEGVKREAIYKNGHYKSLIVMSLLKKEYE